MDDHNVSCLVPTLDESQYTFISLQYVLIRDFEYLHFLVDEFEVVVKVTIEWIK